MNEETEQAIKYVSDQLEKYSPGQIVYIPKGYRIDVQIDYVKKEKDEHK